MIHLQEFASDGHRQGHSGLANRKEAAGFLPAAGKCSLAPLTFHARNCETCKVQRHKITCAVQQEQLVERSLEVVGELLRKKLRERALTALKKKKLHERQAMQLDQNILKIDEQVVALETTEQQVDIVSVLRTANQAMKTMQQQMPLDAVEKLMQENEDAAEYVVRSPQSGQVPVLVLPPHVRASCRK